MGNKQGKGDQAHHNVLFYTGELASLEGIDDIQTWKNFEGAVATTGYTYRATGELRGAIVRDGQGNAIPIIHQFDRARPLMNYFQTKRAEKWLPLTEQLTGFKITMPHSDQRNPS